MTSQHLPSFVQQRDILPDHNHETLYNDARESRIYSVESMAHRPNHSDPEFIVTKPLENQLIAKVEELYAKSNTSVDRGQYRPPVSSSYKRGVGVFFEGRTTIGDESSTYTALIPFYVSGNVTIQGIPLSERSCYDIFGICTLDVPVGGKVGSWMISSVN